MKGLKLLGVLLICIYLLGCSQADNVPTDHPQQGSHAPDRPDDVKDDTWITPDQSETKKPNPPAITMKKPLPPILIPRDQTKSKQCNRPNKTFSELEFSPVRHPTDSPNFPGIKWSQENTVFPAVIALNYCLANLQYKTCAGWPEQPDEPVLTHYEILAFVPDSSRGFGATIPRYRFIVRLYWAIFDFPL